MYYVFAIGVVVHMNILITGGYGFIGSHIAERFNKEGHSIFVVDNCASNARASLNIEHKFYNFNVEDDRCEEIFRIYNIDIVVHLAAKKVQTYNDQKENMLGLMNILSLVKKYEVKQLICSFSSLFFDDDNVKLLDFSGKKQELRTDLEKQYQISAINYCQKFKELCDLNVVLVFLPNVYGDGQTNGVFSIWVKNLFEKKPLVVFGDGKQTRDFVEVNDVTDIFFRIVQREYDKKPLLVSSNKETSINNCLEIFKKFSKDVVAVHGKERSNEIDRMVVEDTFCEKELGWRPRYNIEDGIKKFLVNYQKALEKSQQEKITIGQKQIVTKYWTVGKPYIENVCMFALMIILSQFIHGGTTVNPDIGLDYNYVYILVMGLLYGKQQSIPATILSSCLLAFNITQRFDDFVSMIYKTEYLVHFATYLFFGVLSGYITDNREYAVAFLRKDMLEFKERYNFLEKLYLETINAKNRLYRQIVNSQDTLGSTYKIIQKLDSVEVENVFTSITEIISEIMNTEHVAVYIIGKNKYYLRQKTRVGTRTVGLPKSIKIEDADYLKDILKSRQVFVNKLLVPNLPDMAVPVLNNDEVIAVIQIYDLDFEDLNLYNQNLLKVTSLLISDALRKAYKYEEQVRDKKHIQFTNILIKQEFAKIKQEIYQNRRQRHISISAFTLEIIAGNLDIYEINDRISKVVRDEDFVGENENGNIELILWNIDEEMVKQVQTRIKNVGLDSKEVLEVNNGK